MGWAVSSDTYFSDRSAVGFLAVGGLSSPFGLPEGSGFRSYLPVVWNQSRQT